MSKIGRIAIELMELGALVPENREPDYKLYANEEMRTDTFAKEWTEFDKRVANQNLADLRKSIGADDEC